jgi:hypothetical protein
MTSIDVLAGGVGMIEPKGMPEFVKINRDECRRCICPAR